MKTILITGGAGFIGTNLCVKLLAQGNRVICIDNLTTSSKKNINAIKNPLFTFINHDVIYPLPAGLLDKKRTTIDGIFHLACPTGVPNLTKLAEEMLLTCSTGTKHILDLAIFHQAPLLFTSSSEVYGNPEIFPQTEDYPGNSLTNGIRSPYEEGKRFAESLVSMYVKKYHLDGKIVRIFNTYGAFMQLTDSRVIPHFIKQLYNNEPLHVTGDGSQTRTFCYVDDIISGLLLVMEKGKKGEIYNLGSEEEVSIETLAEKILTVSHKNLPISHIPRPSHDHKGRRPSLQKIKHLGWQPMINLEKGLQKTLTWYGL